jgi:NAD(P)H-flavin reductase
MTEMAASQRPWSGETGLVDDAMLSRHLRDAVAPIYYVAGPPAMVQALSQTLKKQSVSDADIHAEEFSGY